MLQQTTTMLSKQRPKQRVASSRDPLSNNTQVSNNATPVSNSSTWTSGGASERTRLQRLHNIGSHIGVTNSPFFPKTVQEYNRHNMLYKQDTAAYEKKKLNNRLAVLQATSRHLSELDLKRQEKETERIRMKVAKLMGGMEFENGSNRTTVLAEKSIWVAPGSKKDEAHCAEDGGWPIREESKWEGEGQVKQGLVRHFPLPKEDKLSAAARENMLRSGQWNELVKMNRGESAIPFGMKQVKKVYTFDETDLGKLDRAMMRLQILEPTNLEKLEETTDEEALGNGLLRKDLFDEF